MFGPDKVMAINTFGSVTAGLAVIGHEIEAGQAEYKVYTPDLAPETENVTEVKTHRGVKQRVNLGNVQRQIEVTQQVMTDASELPYHVVLSLDVEGQLAMVGADEIVLETAAPDERRVWVQDDGPGIRAALLVTTSDSEKILFATNQYKLALAPARSVLIATRFGAKGVRDLLRLDSGERVTAMLAWNPDRAEKRYVCMVTRTGQIRRLEASLLAIQLRQAPYFKLEKKYSSAPACLAQGDAGDQLVLGTSAGRVTRIPLSELGITIYRGWKTQANEDVTAAVLAPPDAELMAVDQEGRHFYFRCDLLPAASAEGKKSQTLKRGTGIVGFASEHDLLDRRVYAFTGSGGLHALTPPPLRKPPKLGGAPHGQLALGGDWVVAVLGCDAS
jgi:DNA gyrase/topoisomerase IV subunit A